ncbi:hypothetical protein GF420_02215 [candidate division GN15 bacterium]|nr:hypothetical protein [candidate division GN15 bacterium]
MLNMSEKAYVLALRALKQHNYGEAVNHFDQAAEQFATDREFVLLRESTRLLVAVKNELAALRANDDDDAIIEEVFDGQETDISG